MFCRVKLVNNTIKGGLWIRCTYTSAGYVVEYKHLVDI